MPEYRGYSIEAVEAAPLRWFSTVQRLDGRKMKSPTTGAPVEIWECPQTADSAETAIENAKAVINDPGFEVV